MKLNVSKAIGLVVRTRRVLKNIALSDFSRWMGRSASRWSRCETGSTQMTVVDLVKACRSLKTKPSALVRDLEVLMDSKEST